MNTIYEQMRLEGRRALVTGAAGNLGGRFAATLAELGAELLLIDRPNSGLAEVAENLQKTIDCTVGVVECDLEIEDERKDLLDRLISEWDSLSVLVNNAAFVGTEQMPGWSVPFEQQGFDAWRRAQEVNLITPFHLTQGVASLLRSSPGATVVNVGSIHGDWGPDWRLYDGTNMANPAAYATSKAGLHQLTRWLATTLAPDVRVNTIAPGGIARGQEESFVKAYCARTPMARMASEEDMVGALIFLATDLSKYVTGQKIAVDGGWSAW